MQIARKIEKTNGSKFPEGRAGLKDSTFSPGAVRLIIPGSSFSKRWLFKFVSSDAAIDALAEFSVSMIRA